MMLTDHQAVVRLQVQWLKKSIQHATKLESIQKVQSPFKQHTGYLVCIHIPRIPANQAFLTCETYRKEELHIEISRFVKT